jgi:4-amino-4-deoxy-L-arabinose transferase-like glycosyltransferase
MDDGGFIEVARQIRVHPADPFGFRHNWTGREVAAVKEFQNGPLTSYYIALAATCLGWSERALHLAFLLPAAAAILGTYFLALRFCGEPLFAALVTLFCPVFLVSGTTVMADVITLAFFVWAMVLWLRSAEDGSHCFAILSACLIGAASVTRYFPSLTLVPLLFVYSLLRWRDIGWRTLYLAIPLAVFVTYEWVMQSLYGCSLLFLAASTASTMGREGSWFLWRGLTTLCFAGGALAPMVFYAPLLWSRRCLAAGLLAAAIFAGLLAFCGSLGEHPLPGDIRLRLLLASQFSTFVVAGVSVLILVAGDLWRSRDAESVLLALWTLGTLAFCWIFNWSVNGRTILPIAPAVGILIFRRIQQRAGYSPGRHWLAKVVPLLLAGGLAMAVSWADCRFANSTRTAATVILGRYGAEKARVWFIVGWGFYHYMQSYGFKVYETSHPRIGPRDILVVPLNSPGVPDSITAWRSRCTAFDVVSSRIVTTMYPALGAGFYTSQWGPLPFAFGPVPHERYFIVSGAVFNESLR